MVALTIIVIQPSQVGGCAPAPCSRMKMKIKWKIEWNALEWKHTLCWYGTVWAIRSQPETSTEEKAPPPCRTPRDVSKSSLAHRCHQPVFPRFKNNLSRVFFNHRITRKCGRLVLLFISADCIERPSQLHHATGHWLRVGINISDKSKHFPHRPDVPLTWSIGTTCIVLLINCQKSKVF